ncbi:MAG: AMP-binding protein [Proteobacteria bacterium]|nr:AMP-binding protein [Pseudomonadota bacterium]
MKAKKKHDVLIQRSWMVSALERLLNQAPEHPLVIEYGESVISRTRRQFFELSQNLACFLSQRGVRRGSRVIVDIDMRMHWETLVTWLACQMLSASAFFWPPDMRFRHARKETVSADEMNGGPAIVITGSPERAKRWLEDDEERGVEHRLIIYLSHPDVKSAEVTFKGKTPANLVSFERAVSADESQFNIMLVGEEAALVYTQGSHQEARLVSLSYAHLMAQAEDIRSHVKLDNQARVFIDLTSPHTVCLVLFAACLQCGATLVCRSRNWDVGEILRTGGVSHAFLLPRTLEKLSKEIVSPEDANGAVQKWRRLCLRFGKYRIRNAQSSLNWMIDSVCVEPTRKKLFPHIQSIISYGNHFDSKVGELFSFLNVPVMNAYTVSEIGFVHLHTFMGSGGYLKSIEPRVKNGVLSVKANRAGTSYICTDDLIFEDSRCGLCTHRNLLLHLNTGITVDVSPMRDILRREPLIDEVFIFGEDRPFLTALIYLNRSVLKSWSMEQGIEAESFESMSQNPKLYRHIREIVDACNLLRTSDEAIQKIAILTRPIDEDPRILTPCSLTRRTDVEHRYMRILNSFYSESF